MNKFFRIVLIFVINAFLSSCFLSVQKKSRDKFRSMEGMVLIPSGEFLMGGKSGQADIDEFPRHKVKLTEFYLDVTEVTNKQFHEFVEATGYITVAEREVDWVALKKQLPPEVSKPADSLLSPGSLVFNSSKKVSFSDPLSWWQWTMGANWKQPEGPGSHIKDRMDHPVVHICWEDANEYAKWAGKRLPTEAEWEWAAMGGDNDTVYPWGNKPIGEATGLANFWQGFFPYENLQQDGFPGTAPVKSYPPNKYGLYDMAGNVWEWCSDKYHARAYGQYNNQIVTNPKGPSVSFDPLEPHAQKYVMRGGSFLCNESYCSGYRVSRRMKSSGDSGFNHTGFRCAKSISID